MTETVKEPFCPLYKEVVAGEPWNKSVGAHRGLLFDKFANAWRTDERASYAFDKGVGPKKEDAGKWLRKMAAECGDSNQLAEACRRQQQLAAVMGGKPVLLKNSSRFVTGLGREHPLENGFAWHHTLGVPYLPGSSLKGMLRAWYRENGSWDETEQPWRENHSIRTLFGSHETDENRDEHGVGQFVLLDMLPTTPPELAVDIMTPHYGPYYQGEKGQTPPGDWHSPTPISFLVVEAEVSWQLAILPRRATCGVSPGDLENLTEMLGEAFIWLGAGAKTAVGYGRFERDLEGERRREARIEREQDAKSEAQRLAREQAEFQASIANDSTPLRELKQLRRDQDWKLAASDNNMLSALEAFAERHDDPPPDCLDWIREVLESIPSYKGVWNNPEATKGKPKKPKPKYSSPRIRRLVLRLNPDGGR